MIMDYNFNSVVARYDLTTAQADMLILLFHNKGTPMCQKDIEERLGLKNPTVTGTLKRLEAKGFIKRVPLESDHRFNQITPTPRAWELDSELLKTIRTNDERMLNGFSDEERAQLDDYLNRIIENLTEKADGLYRQVQKVRHSHAVRNDRRSAGGTADTAGNGGDDR